MCGSSCCWHLLCCVFFCSSVSSECWSRAECLHATACTSWAARVPWAEMLRALWNGVKGRNGRGSLIQLAFPAGAVTDVTTILIDLIQPSLEIFGLIQTYKQQIIITEMRGSQSAQSGLQPWKHSQICCSFPSSLNLPCCLQAALQALFKLPQIDQSLKKTPFLSQGGKAILPSTDISCSHLQLECVDSLQQEKHSLPYQHWACYRGGYRKQFM